MIEAGSGSLYLGLDVGTTNAKALVLDATGRVRSSASAPVPIHHRGRDAVEQDLGEIVAGVREALGKAVSACGRDAGRIAAIGVSSQGAALQLLDRAGNPQGPVISWQDGRGGPWDARHMVRHSRRWFERRIGIPGSRGCLGQIARLRAEGAIGAETKIGWVGDRIVGWLCGRPAHDATSLSIASLCNPLTGRADPDVLALVGLEPSLLPDLLSAREPAGGLLPEPARALGLPSGIPVGPAVHDQYAAAFGCGATAPGEAMLGVGTAWVLLAASPRMPRSVAGSSLVCRHLVDGQFGLMLSLVNGGSSLAWALRTLGLEGIDERALDARLASVAIGSDGLRFRPLLAPAGGAGLPPGMAGRLDGIRLGHTASHVLRAVVEGLAGELGRFLALLRGAGLRVERLAMCGRAAGSAATPAIVADITGLPIDCVAAPDISAVGAAMLGRALVEPDVPLASLSAAMKPDVRRVAPGSGRPAGVRLMREYLRSVRRK